MEITISVAVVIAVSLAVLAVLAFAVANVIGARLPVGHQARRTAELLATPERIWEQIADPSWARSDTKFETVEAARPTRLVRSVVGETAFGGTWTFNVEPSGRGSTRLTITEDGEIYNTFFRFMSRYVIGHYRGIDGYIAALRQRLAGTEG